MKPFLEGHTDWSESQYPSAIHGLSDALKSIHNLSTADQSWTKKGCHGDLKPNNILVDGHKFILIDFGLGKIRQPSESSGGNHSMTGIYAAPECQGLDAYPVESFRTCDIWSFGCILAELVVFMDTPAEDAFKKYEAQRKEIQGRRTSTAFHLSGQHKERVWAPLDAIEKRTHSIVIKKLIQLIRRMLQINYRERPDARVVTETIAGIMKMEQDPTANPDRDVKSALATIEEVDAVDERRDGVVSPLMTSADQREAELRARRVQIGQEVKQAYARFDRLTKPIGKKDPTRKKDLDVALAGFLKARAELQRPLEVFDLSLHRRIYWVLMVTEKELSQYHSRDCDLTTRMGHIEEAERYCDALQFSDAAAAIQLRIESHVIRGLKARLGFKRGDDMGQTEREKKDSIDGIDEDLKLLKAIDEGRFESICVNVRGWRDLIARSDI